ncbi:MAG TPA: multicopper oxidase domain-containing protein [Candidatus Baltobacteraceae bacterium]|nr:multicopper oxidase domain-containing protein [Candidatus Baltobacteraceae bacterium]
MPRVFGISVLLAVFAFASGAAAAPPTGGRAFQEPVILSSKDGVLEVTLTSRQTTGYLDTVSGPVKHMLLFDYSVERGTSSNGEISGGHMYPAPTLHVEPGERLIVHINNELRGLSISDYYDPKYTPAGQTVPLYPTMLTSSPINLHVHGAHVSPRGNADNVLLHIDAGMSNTYVYDIPKNMTPGTFWYHSHLHTLTAMQTYYGLAGMLLVGRADSEIPLVTQKNIPIRTMLLQYNAVFDRKDGLTQMTNPNWPQWVSTLVPPKGDELANGTYRPLLAPVNFLESHKGTRWATVWYAGPLSINNTRGRFQFIPMNLQRFTPFAAGDPAMKPNLKLPDYERDTQFTVNGQFEPELKVKPGQTEVWVLANVSDIAYMNVQLTETATGYHPKFAIVGQDGLAYQEVEHPHEQDGTQLLIPPATRYAIAVTMPQKGSLRLELPGLGSSGRAVSAPGILYTNDGTKNPPAVLGSLSILPQSISYADGFFLFPSQTLLNAMPDEGQGVTTTFEPGQKLDAPTPFHDLSKVKPDVSRTILINGGFLNNHASKQDPKAFVYAFAGNAFPNVPLIQARLGSVEEWNFVNENNDAHPIHVHVNDFQVTKYNDPTTGTKLGPMMFGQDNANVPAPLMGPQEAVIHPGTLTMRTHFIDYLGLYVLHCHRLNHEDNGLMMLVNVIPAVSDYAVAVPGSPGHPARVNVFDGNGDKPIATVTPFQDFFGTPSVAMGDVDGDGVYDLIVGAGKGHSPEVVAYSGVVNDGKPFANELARFQAFDTAEMGGVSVASTQVDGRAPDNIIVGSGAGTTDRVRIFSSELPAVGTMPKTFATFEPYGSDTSGVSIAAGFVDFLTGRDSIVTAPGTGSQVKVFSYSLMTPIGAPPAWPDNPGTPHLDATFAPFGTGYRGAMSIAAGWLAGSYGGAEAIAAGRLSGVGTVKVFSTGTALQGNPKMYLHSAMMHELASNFTEIASFEPFAGSVGARVATTSTTTGADLLVSGASGGSVRVEKFRLTRANPQAHVLTARPVHAVQSGAGKAPEVIGGD